MASKSVYVAVFVAAMMATVAASAVIVATHDDEMKIVFDGTGLLAEWDKVATALNTYWANNDIEGRWEAMADGLVFYLPGSANMTVAQMYTYFNEAIGAYAIPKGITEYEEFVKIAGNSIRDYPEWYIDSSG